MKPSRIIFLVFAFLAVLSGCTKNEEDFAVPQQIPSGGTGLKSLNDDEVAFGTLGTVRLVSTAHVKGENFKPAATVFTYKITPGSVPVTGLDLLVSICSTDPVIYNAENSTVTYSIDPFFRTSKTYKNTKWLILNNIVDFSKEVSFKLDGVWYAEPRTAILTGASTYAIATLPLPVCQTGAGLANVQTVSIVENGGNLVVTGKITDPGIPPYYECGIMWSSTGVPFYPESADHMIASAGAGDDNTFSCTLEGVNPGSTYYIRAYVLNNWYPYTHDLGIGYGNLLAFNAPPVTYGQLTDIRDNYTYQTVKIGTQTWMAENLRYLPYVNPPFIRKTPSKDPIMVYGYTGTNVAEARSTENYLKYGALYSYGAATTLCPDGWYLPSDEEWQALEAYLGMQEPALSSTGWRTDGNVAEPLKSMDGWIWGKDYSHAVGTNATGFNALAGGNGSAAATGVSFSNLGTWGQFWTSTRIEGKDDKAYRRGFTYYDQSVDRGTMWFTFGYSVRCVKKDE